MAHDVFISYQQADKAVADAVCHRMEAAGVRCWIAPRDIAHGKTWDDAVVDALTAAKILVVIFSAAANASHTVLDEVAAALDAGATVMPFRIEDIHPTGGLRLRLGRVHWLDALTPPLDVFIDQLIDSAKRNLPLAREVEEDQQRAQQEAEQRQREAEDQAAWQVAKARQTIAAYDHYLTIWPTGIGAPEAAEARRKVEEEERAAEVRRKAEEEERTAEARRNVEEAERTAAAADVRGPTLIAVKEQSATSNILGAIWRGQTFSLAQHYWLFLGIPGVVFYVITKVLQYNSLSFTPGLYEWLNGVLWAIYNILFLGGYVGLIRCSRYRGNGEIRGWGAVAIVITTLSLIGGVVRVVENFSGNTSISQLQDQAESLNLQTPKKINTMTTFTKAEYADNVFTYYYDVDPALFGTKRSINRSSITAIVCKQFKGSLGTPTLRSVRFVYTLAGETTS